MNGNSLCCDLDCTAQASQEGSGTGGSDLLPVKSLLRPTPGAGPSCSHLNLSRTRRAPGLSEAVCTGGNGEKHGGVRWRIATPPAMAGAEKAARDAASLRESRATSSPLIGRCPRRALVTGGEPG